MFTWLCLGSFDEMVELHRIEKLRDDVKATLLQEAGVVSKQIGMRWQMGQVHQLRSKKCLILFEPQEEEEEEEEREEEEDLLPVYSGSQIAKKCAPRHGKGIGSKKLITSTPATSGTLSSLRKGDHPASYDSSALPRSHPFLRVGYLQGFLSTASPKPGLKNG